MTYRCTNRCSFCTRNVSDYVKGYNLRLDKDPSINEIISAVGDVSKYDEIVFCGFGEPTLRLGAVKTIAAYVKEKGGKVRMVTNGEGGLIAGRPIAGELEGLIDRVSVSLNSADEEAYQRICSSVFGKEAHKAAISFIKDCNTRGIKVEITCLDLPGEDVVAGVRRLAEELGADFRLRHLNVVG
jgi:TatD DNase family protein